MNPTTFWTTTVNDIVGRRNTTFDNAWTAATREHRDAHTLMVAIGATRETVQFFNDSVLDRRRPAPAPRGHRGRQFVELVHERMRLEGLQYDDAWAKCLRDHPEFGNDVSVPTAGEAEMVALAQGRVPVACPHLNALLCLPAGTGQSEFAAAFVGNGGQGNPLNPGKTFAALVEYWQQQRGMEYEAALALAKERYPHLWQLVDKIARK